MSADSNIAFSIPQHVQHHHHPPPPPSQPQSTQPSHSQKQPPQHHHTNGIILSDLSGMGLAPSGTSSIVPPHAVAPGAGVASADEPFILRLSNLPHDLTKREASLIFALVIDDIVNIEQNGEEIIAYFKNLSTCTTTGKLLEGKSLFGGDHLPVKIDYDHFTSYQVTQPFQALRLSSGSNISPPQINTNASDFQKRQSIGTQRSRFLFSDPFSGSATPTSAIPPTSSTSTAVPSAAQGPPSASVGPRINLSDLTGKSLLLMESQNDAREYEQLVRDPWKTGAGAPQTTSAPNGGHVGGHSSSTPQTPSAGPPPPPGAFEWASTTSAAAGTGSDRRRTSSAFFNSSQPQSAVSAPPHILSAQNPLQPLSLSNNTLTQQQHAQPQQQNLHMQQAHQEVQATQQSQPQQQHQQQQLPQNVSNQQSRSSSQSPPQLQVQTSNSNQQSPQAHPSGSRQKDVPDLSLLARVPPPANPADQNPPCNTLYVGNLPPDATEVELRALFSPQKGFRRLSFRTKTQSQSNPNANSHNHGPMCFVEFEDVAHATRALAELYGRALPRPGGTNGKGGIRLSFSKNPLGVRGPGNPRRTSSSQVMNGGSVAAGAGSSSGTSSQGTNASNGNAQPNTASASFNSNGVGNYGYSNYHKA
ncbi:RRM domain-containing protein [[Candida] zeylanoides]